MRKQVVCLFALIFSVALAGCSSGKATGKSNFALGERCIFPGTQQLAPGWICDEPQPEWEATATGSAEKLAAGLESQKQQAATAAKVGLVLQARAQVSSMVQLFAMTTGNGNAQAVDRINASVTKQITDQTLIGSKLIRSAMGPDGRLWVLAGIDAKGMEALVREAVRNSYDSDQSLWQSLQGTKTLDELTDAIAAQKVAGVSGSRGPAAK